jgi:3-hydroxy-9,10-secoandrosta-1,3,5(10)-triene-9,17-dione monooxygenase reductase component
MMAVSTENFKKVLGAFCTGVTIVTFSVDDQIHGLTVNAFSSVSLQPQLVLICIDKSGNSYPLISQCSRFVVNILSEKQDKLAWKFADPKLTGVERFADTSFTIAESGIPVFTENLADLYCRISDHFDAGDHTIFIGHVDDVHLNEEKKPLIYYRSSLQTL